MNPTATTPARPASARTNHPRGGSAPPSLGRLVAWVLAAGGGIGLAAAFVLTAEKIALLADPTYVPSCSINPILSCGSVMTTPQAEVFGFPNPLLGIVGFAIVTTAGTALLAGARLRRWFWLGLQVGATAGVVFVHWLIFQSLFRIGALCPYCMVVWAVTIPVFWYTTLHNLQAGHLPVPAAGRRLVNVMVRYHAVVLTGWVIAITGLVAAAFWSYWSTLL